MLNLRGFPATSSMRKCRGLQLSVAVAYRIRSLKNHPIPNHATTTLLSQQRFTVPVQFNSLSNPRSIHTDRSLNQEVKVNAFQNELPEGLRREAMPRHVAVIMDGNSRWAKRRGLPSSSGHEAGVQRLKQLIDVCRKWEIRVLTVFAFSFDNWDRPKMEVDVVMSLLEGVIKTEINNFDREGIRLSFIGDSSNLPESLWKVMTDAEERTKDNSVLQLIFAVSYSGKYDVVQACKSVSQKVKDGLIQAEDINESIIEQELETNCTEFPYPDLLIRTSGELRLSNFLLWQLAYTELFFAPALWPDFGKAEFAEALISFQERKRRYGRRDP